MQKNRFPVILGGALLLYAAYLSQQPPADKPADSAAKPALPRKPIDKPKPRTPPCPNCPMLQEAGGQSAQSGETGEEWAVATIPTEDAPACADHKPQLGGVVSPDGSTRSVIWQDNIDWPKNIASRGLGCCGFRSLDYCARMQGVPEFIDWPEHLRSDGIAGGAYPQKVEQLIHKYGPQVQYWQDTSKSHALLEACVRSQRGCAVDYNGHDPHYVGRIAHCVTLIAFSLENDWAAIIDNNYPELDQIVWMSVAEFDKRWGGWAYGLLAMTPGYIDESSNSGESWEFFAGKDGTINYGLSKQGPFGNYCRMNGEDSTTEDIITAIGPEMMPIPIKVDHKFEPFKLDFTPLTIALAGGAVLLFQVLTQKESN